MTLMTDLNAFVLRLRGAAWRRATPRLSRAVQEWRAARSPSDPPRVGCDVEQLPCAFPDDAARGLSLMEQDPRHQQPPPAEDGGPIPDAGQPEPAADAVFDAVRALFDADWYLQTYPDVAQAGLNPLRHYLEHGAAEGRDPSPLFSTRWYLQTYPDVAQAGLNPLRHYLDHGAAEGRLPRPPAPARRGPSQEALAAATALIEEFAGSEFDLARLRHQPLDALPVIPDLPESLAEAWRSLYLSLDRAPRTLLIVPSLDDERLRRHLLCVCHHAIASGDPAALLVLAADETRPSVAAAAPGGVVWRSLAEFRADLDIEEKVAIVVALIHALRPQAALVLESAVGWRAIARQGVALHRLCGLFAAFVSLAGDALEGAEEDDLALRYLRECLPFLAAVYASDPAWVDDLAARYGLPAATRRNFRFLPPAADDAEWVRVLARDPGFLAKKGAARP